MYMYIVVEALRPLFVQSESTHVDSARGKKEES